MLTRRGFLKSFGLVAAPVLAGIPIASAREPVAGVKFSKLLWFDFGNQAAIAITLPNGKQRAARMTVNYRRRHDVAYMAKNEAYLKARLLDWAVAQC